VDTGVQLRGVLPCSTRQVWSTNGADELCFQQSTGDSTSPEVDISKSAVWKDFTDDDVRDLHDTSRP